MSDPLGNTGQSTVRLSYEQLRDTLGRFAYFRHWTEDQVCVLWRSGSISLAFFSQLLLLF